MYALLGEDQRVGMPPPGRGRAWRPPARLRHFSILWGARFPAPAGLRIRSFRMPSWEVDAPRASTARLRRKQASRRC
jgi:hypothetical protein